MIHKCIKTAVLLLPLFFFGVAPAEEYESPDTIQGSTRVDAESLISLARGNPELVIIDSRIQADRRQGYITGSINLPDTDTNCESLQSVIAKKDNAALFYCNGPKCRRSYRAVMIAKACGYTNIYWFRGGMEEWKNKNFLISK